MEEVHSRRLRARDRASCHREWVATVRTDEGRRRRDTVHRQGREAGQSRGRRARRRADSDRPYSVCILPALAWAEVLEEEAV